MLPSTFTTFFFYLDLSGCGGASHSSESSVSFSAYQIITSLVSGNTFVLSKYLTSYVSQMEATVHEAYIKAGKLRQWLHKPACPDVIRECKILLDKATAPKIQDEECWGSDFVHQGKAQTPPKDLSILLGGEDVCLIPHLAIHDVRYSSSSRHLGNSLVCYYPKGNTSSPPIPGSIKYIYRKGESTYFALQRQLPRAPEDPQLDPFARYPDFPASLYQARVSETLEAVEVDWVLCHYARWNVTAKHAVVLMLTKVSTSAYHFTRSFH